MTEAKNINRSLAALGNVIRELMKRAQATQTNTTALSTQQQQQQQQQVTSSNGPVENFVPYRDSRLTFLLRDSLGGNSLTYLIACVSSSANAFFETLSTLKFARMASAVRNCAKVNENEKASVEALKDENHRLKETLNKLLAQHQLASRRMSMVGGGGTGALNRRESYFGLSGRESCVGLLTPTRLRATNHNGATGGANERDDNSGGGSGGDGNDRHHYAQLFRASHEREARWVEEIETMKKQVEILEKKTQLDGMRMRLQTKEIERLKGRASSVATDPPTVPSDSSASSSLVDENAYLREELSLLKSHGVEVSHAPSLVEAYRQIYLMRDALESRGIDVAKMTATGQPGDTSALAHRREFALQQQIDRLQNELDQLRDTGDNSSSSSLVATVDALELSTAHAQIVDLHSALSVAESELATQRDTNASLESQLVSERSKVAHLESRLEFVERDASVKLNDAEEQLLLRQVTLVQLERERDTLVRQVRDLEQVTDLYASQANEHTSTTERVMEQVKHHQATIERLTQEVTHAQSRTTQLDHTIASLIEQNTDLAQARDTVQRELATLDATYATHRTNSYVALDEWTRTRHELESRVTALEIEVATTSSALSALQNEHVRETRLTCELRATNDATQFAYDALRDEHDTLVDEFAFVTKQLDDLRRSHGELVEELEQTTHRLAHAQSELTEERRTRQQATNENESATKTTIDRLYAEKQALQTTNEQLEQELSAMSKRLEIISVQEAAILELTESNGELKSHLATVTTQLLACQTDSHALRSERASLADELAFEQDRATKLAERVDSLESDLTRAHKQIDSLAIDHTQQIERANFALEAASQRSNEREKELRAECDAMAAVRDALASQVQEKEALIVDLRAECDRLTRATASLDSTIGEMTSELANLRTVESSLRAEKLTLETKLNEIAAMTSAINAAVEAEEENYKHKYEQLTKEYQVSQRELNDARAQLSTCQGTLEQSESTVTELRGRLHRIEAECATKDASFDALQSTLESLESLRHKRDAEISSMHQTVAALNQQHAQLHAQLHERQSQVATLEKRVHELEIELVESRSHAEFASKDETILLQLQVDLSTTQELLRTSMADREQCITELQKARQDESTSIAQYTALRLEADAMVEELAHLKEKLSLLQKEHVSLEETIAQLTGHQNQKQKIQLHQQIKKENEILRQEKMNLDREVKKCRKLVLQLNGGTMPSSSQMSQVEKELLQADELMRAGEQAQAQLKTVSERIAAMAEKVKHMQENSQGDASGEVAPIDAAAPLPPLPSKDGSTSASTTPTPSAAATDLSFAHCLASIATIASVLTRQSTQLQQARRDANNWRSQFELVELKEKFAQQKQAITSMKPTNQVQETTASQ